MKTENNYLKKLLNRIKKLSLSEKKILAIFDLDSTLFNVTKRSQEILRDFAQEPNIAHKFPYESKILTKIETFHNDWGVKRAVERQGITNSEFFILLRDYWIEHFFSNNYLHKDFPYNGAVDFVNDIRDYGANIMYLTGRDEKSMLHGTVTSLKHWQFPLNSPGVELKLKPGKHLIDADFKLEEISRIESQHDFICFFENEPVIINRILSLRPKVHVVYMDSVHSGQEEINIELPTLKMMF